MKDSMFQIKHPSTPYYQWLRHSSRASLHASHPISSTIHLLTHCTTMSAIVVCRPNGYMHNELDRASGKTTNKRLLLDLETSSLNNYTASHQKYSSQEVAR
jgi:hypothetical protein